MTRALFRKQMLETFSWVYRNRKSGKRRGTKGIIGYALMYLLLFIFLGAIFYAAGSAMCAPLLGAGVGWLYWCLMGLIGLFLGVFGSVFNTYSSLYRAKDNDLLLSMPIPPSRILLTRLSGVYAMGLLYELIVMIPALLARLLAAPVTLAGVCFALLSMVMLSLIVLVLSAVLGWVVALVTGRLKRKNGITVLISLVFFAAYYYMCSHLYVVLQVLLQDAAGIGARMKAWVYPLYQMGLAAEGNALSMLIFAAMAAALLAVVWLVLERSFLRLATANRGEVRRVYREKRAKPRTAGAALLAKELRRFTGSANYMLNCGLGILFMPLAAIALIWKGELIRQFAGELLTGPQTALLAVAAVCMLATMNDMTAPSVSLEGKNLWLAQALPVSPQQVLLAKLKLHLILTLVPAALLLAAVEWVLRPSALYAVLMAAAVVLFIVLMGAAGLAANLRMPNLTWSSEIIPIKQSAAVAVTLFGGWVLVMALGGLYVLLRGVLTPAAYLGALCAALLAACVLVLRWIWTRGARRFMEL